MFPNTVSETGILSLVGGGMAKRPRAEDALSLYAIFSFVFFVDPFFFLVFDSLVFTSCAIFDVMLSNFLIANSFSQIRAFASL